MTQGLISVIQNDKVVIKCIIVHSNHTFDILCKKVSRLKVLSISEIIKTLVKLRCDEFITFDSEYYVRTVGASTHLKSFEGSIRKPYSDNFTDPKYNPLDPDNQNTFEIKAGSN